MYQTENCRNGLRSRYYVEDRIVVSVSFDKQSVSHSHVMEVIPLLRVLLSFSFDYPLLCSEVYESNDQ